MAAYCQVYAMIHFTPPAGWLPVHRDQLQAQRSVISMGFIHKKLPVSTPCTIYLWWCWHAKSAVSTEMTQNKQNSHRSRLTVLQMTKQQPNCFLFMPAFTVTGFTTCIVAAVWPQKCMRYIWMPKPGHKMWLESKTPQELHFNGYSPSKFGLASSHQFSFSTHSGTRLKEAKSNVAQPRNITLHILSSHTTGLLKEWTLALRWQ